VYGFNCKNSKEIIKMDQSLKSEMIMLGLEGRNIDAIRLYRDRTKCSLKEAKKTFEGLVKAYWGTKLVDRKITITIEPREDGGLCAYSDDVSGLILSHKNHLKVLYDIIPALMTLLEDRKSK